MCSDAARARLLTLALVATLALGLSACGRRGALEAPPDPAAEAAAAKKAEPGVDSPVGRPKSRRNKDTRIVPPRVDTPFDWLL